MRTGLSRVRRHRHAHGRLSQSLAPDRRVGRFAGRHHPSHPTPLVCVGSGGPWLQRANDRRHAWAQVGFGHVKICPSRRRGPVASRRRGGRPRGRLDGRWAAGRRRCRVGAAYSRVTRVEAIAQIVSGEGEAPNWLVPNLRTARDTLAWSIRTETQFPERAPPAEASPSARCCCGVCSPEPPRYRHLHDVAGRRPVLFEPKRYVSWAWGRRSASKQVRRRCPGQTRA